jgi:hypothetical protein
MVRGAQCPVSRRLLPYLFFVLLSSPWGIAARAQDAKLIVFAAASLKDALDEVNAAYQREKGQETATSYAASSTLAKQIEAAAPADVFISADLDWMDYLAKKNLIKPETRANLLGNRLQCRQSRHRTELPTRSSARQRPARDRRPKRCAGRKIWQGSARVARRVVIRRRSAGAGGKRAGDLGAGFTRRDAPRNRLPDRRRLR